MSDELAPLSVRNAVMMDEERQFELSLRPTRLAEYIGQKKATDNLRAAHRVSPIVCSGACATSRRSSTRVRSRKQSPAARSTGWRLILTDWTRWIASCS